MGESFPYLVKFIAKSRVIDGPVVNGEHGLFETVVLKRTENGTLGLIRIREIPLESSNAPPTLRTQTARPSIERHPSYIP